MLPGFLPIGRMAVENPGSARLVDGGVPDGAAESAQRTRAVAHRKIEAKIYRRDRCIDRQQKLRKIGDWMNIFLILG
jgi:hypothetical protein